MIDRITLDDVILKQRTEAKENLEKANATVYNVASQYIIEIFADSKNKCLILEDITGEFHKRYDARFSDEDIAYSIQRLVDSKRLIRYWKNTYKLAD